MPAINRYYSSVAVDTTLKFAITDPDGTSFEVNSTAGFPTSYPYTLAIGYDSSNEELVTVIGASGGILTVGLTVAGGPSAAGRGVDGTNNQTHTAGETVKHVVSARDMTEAQAHIAAEAAVHGITGGFVGTTDTQTLTNKTINGGTVNPTTLQQGGVPAVTTTGTQTLTNKTISSTNNTMTVAQAAVTNLTSDLALKAPLASPTFTGTVVLPSTTSIGTVSSTELNYLDGVTSAIQTQLNTNTPVGSITMWSLATAPTGWQICDGSAASTPALATALGTANVPDMRGFVPAGFKNLDDAFGTLKGTGGSKTSTAAHTHGLASHTHTTNHDHGAFNTGGGEHQHATTTQIDKTSPLANGTEANFLIDVAPKSGGLNYLVTNAGEGGHEHSIDVPNFDGSSGGPSNNTSDGSSAGATNGNLQPYFTLNFIIKH